MRMACRTDGQAGLEGPVLGREPRGWPRRFAGRPGPPDGPWLDGAGDQGGVGDAPPGGISPATGTGWTSPGQL